MKIGPIICTLMLLVSSALARQSKPLQCMNDIRRLSNALDAFRDQYGVYPEQQSWPDELFGTFNCTLNTHRIRFIESNRELVDRWGNAFVFVAPGKHKTNAFDLYSLGRDGKSVSGGNDPDDVNNWNPEHTWLYKAYGVLTQEQAERRSRIIFTIPFLVLGLAVAAEIALLRQWIKKRRSRSQQPLSPRYDKAFQATLDSVPERTRSNKTMKIKMAAVILALVLIAAGLHRSEEGWVCLKCRGGRLRLSSDWFGIVYATRVKHNGLYPQCQHSWWKCRASHEWGPWGVVSVSPSFSLPDAVQLNHDGSKQPSQPIAGKPGSGSTATV